MLKRYAFLVGSTHGYPALPSIRDDLVLMKNYLMSSRGGGWRRDEVRIFLNRPVFDLCDRVERLRSRRPDFFLFYWSGHGYMNDMGQMLHPFPAEAISLECFYGVADRQLMILDTCRLYRNGSSVLSESLREVDSATENQQARYRRVYDHYIAKCEPSLQIAYACQAGGKGTNFLSGSLYTTSLVNRALRWQLPSRRRYGFASICRLMRNPFFNGEKPEYYNSCRGIKPRHFPFAVGLYC